ncbi:hypothetical protein ACUXLJ_002257 [Staphylococcus hominis]
MNTYVFGVITKRLEELGLNVIYTIIFVIQSHARLN